MWNRVRGFTECYTVTLIIDIGFVVDIDTSHKFYRLHYLDNRYVYLEPLGWFGVTLPCLPTPRELYYSVDLLIRDLQLKVASLSTTEYLEYASEVLEYITMCQILAQI